MAEFDIMYGEGVSKTGEILDTAVDMGNCEKKAVLGSATVKLNWDKVVTV